MSDLDKAHNKADELAGKAKEKVGQVIGGSDTENKGKADQVKSNLKTPAKK